MGTFLLVLTVGCNVLGGNATWGGVSIAFVLMVSIYAMGAVSGANFNPAVSVTLGISKAMGGPGLDWKTVAQYSAVQTPACRFQAEEQSAPCHPVGSPYTCQVIRWCFCCHLLLPAVWPQLQSRAFRWVWVAQRWLVRDALHAASLQLAGFTLHLKHP